jgi:cytochrome b involved in lipid metabolism
LELLNQLKWTVVDGKVYDITYYINEHPGGKKILRGLSKDSTEMFHKFHKGVQLEKTPL